jgi:hypothetical protein
MKLNNQNAMFIHVYTRHIYIYIISKLQTSTIVKLNNYNATFDHVN